MVVLKRVEINDTEVTQGIFACLAEGRVEVSVPPKIVNALLGTLDRFKSDKRA
jgi:hypothetical protein